MEFFIHPDRLWHLLWIIPALTIAAIWASVRRQRALHQLLGKAHFSEKGKLPVGIDTSPNKRLLRFFLLIATAILLTAAWARPSWGEKIVPFTGAGRDVVVALDLSKSMLCEDVKPNRLEHAKRFADELSARLPGDRFGLVSFAGKALDVCPLTFDRVSFRYILNDQKIGTVPVGGTNLEAALKTAASAFDAAENPGHCAIVLISDGGELTGSLAREAEKLRASKLPVVVIGVGDPAIAAPIPVPQENGRVAYLKDRDGNTVNTRLEETPLAELAAKTGGVYIRSTTTEMGDALAAAWIKKLTPGAQKENVHAVPIERREWVLIPALLFFSLYLLLGESLSRTRGLRASAFRLLLRAPKLLIGTLLLIGITGHLPAQTEAAEATEENENAPEESAEALYNRALQAQEQGDIARSRELYQSALARPQVSPELRSATTQNLGAGFHAEGRNGTRETGQAAQTNLDEALKNAGSAEKKFEQARTFYRDFLRANDAAETAGTTRNLQILLNEMKQLEELKKQIQELKKQQQEAAQKAQEAAQQQQQANDEKNAGQEQNQQQQNAANQAQEQARQAADQMRQSAEKLNNESLKNAAQEASRELQKAQEAQAGGDGEKAEEHLKKAAEILQSEMQKNGQSDSEKQDASDQKQSDSQASEGEDSRDENKDGESNGDQGQDDLSQEPEEQSAAAAKAAEEERELDRAATEAVLRDMAQEEAERRKAIQQIRNSRVREVEKDW